MCKYRYMYERERYLCQGHTFCPDTEGKENIMTRRRQFLEPKGLQVNHRLPYIYGIWKSAKENLRWISGVKKSDRSDTTKGKPKGSIAGAGDELVGLLNSVMQSLRCKDSEGRRQGKPKKCWFIESVEEVAQPLRFNATEIASFKTTATTVDFVTMYPSFDQKLLKARIEDAIREAWEWEDQRSEEGTVLRVRRDGWVRGSLEELADTHGNWSIEELLELVTFVVNNGYVQRGTRVLKQVKGFGMGLACAPQIANLGCYPAERDYAARRDPKDVEHNYRFIDDILTLTGCIPSEEEYKMEYKVTRNKEGDFVFLGMELKWECRRGTARFVTGMHFRDSSYPIRIRRYPAEGSMITESQRLGVVTGQFIRAQRLCSTLEKMKQAVQGVVLACMRRGYHRRELDRMWGKFLLQWWKAEEVRRGELRAWFRKMTSVVHRTVQCEQKGIELPEDRGLPCRYGGKCWYKDKHCPFSHPIEQSKGAQADTRPPPPSTQPEETHVPQCQETLQEDTRERIPKQKSKGVVCRWRWVVSVPLHWSKQQQSQGHGTTQGTGSVCHQQVGR
jgi:hypothetical protein